MYTHLDRCIYIYIIICLECNGYHHRKWTQQPEFKSWMRQFAFSIALIPLGNVWIQLFSLKLWVNSRVDCALQPWYSKWIWTKNKSKFKPVKLHLKLTLCYILLVWRGWVNIYNNYYLFVMSPWASLLLYSHINLWKKKKKKKGRTFTQNIYTIDTISTYRWDSFE